MWRRGTRAETGKVRRPLLQRPEPTCHLCKATGEKLRYLHTSTWVCSVCDRVREVTAEVLAGDRSFQARQRWRRRLGKTHERDGMRWTKTRHGWSGVAIVVAGDPRRELVEERLRSEGVAEDRIQAALKARFAAHRRALAEMDEIGFFAR